MPAPEDIADTATSARLLLGLQPTAPPVGTVFAKGARVRYPVALRRLMPTFRAMKALLSQETDHDMYLLLGQIWSPRKNFANREEQFIPPPTADTKTA